jgi:UDP-N-acetylmuramoyl-tripeptide--D-alanyl-D-alanine ligase
VLGDMLELGPDSPALHAEIGIYASTRCDGLIAVGTQARHLADAARAQLGERVLHTEDPRDAAEHAWRWSAAGDVILVKASRGMRLERVLDALAEQAAR